MILGRIKMIATAVTALAFTGIIGIAWYLHAGNARLERKLQQLEQINAELAVSALNQSEIVGELQNSIRLRDDLARQAVQAREDADHKLKMARQALHEALQDDECAGAAHPAAVGDWLRKSTDDL